MANFSDNIEQKSRLYGSLGSAGIFTVLFLILFFLTLPSIVLPSQEGILVSFGDSFDGGGFGGDYGGSAGGNLDENAYATPQGQPQPSNLEPITATKIKGNDDVIATQDEPSEAYIAEQKAKQEAINRAKEQEHIAREQEAERQRQLAEQRRKEQEAIDKAAKMGSAFQGGETSAKGSGTGFGTGTGSGSATGNGSGNGNGTGTGVGDGDGSGRQGNPVGRGNPNGSWSLTGRELIGSLAKPNYNSNEEGKVTVNITVDKQGNVTDASVGSPTTISDREIRNAAIAAAKKTRFSSGTGISTGSITYNFKLN